MLHGIRVGLFASPLKKQFGTNGSWCICIFTYILPRGYQVVRVVGRRNRWIGFGSGSPRRGPRTGAVAEKRCM